MSTLILGCGRLGSELHKQTNWDVLCRKTNVTFDLNDYEYMEFLIKNHIHDTVINCIAHTDTLDNNKYLHWKTNYLSVINLVNLCNKYNKKLTHISSDYIYSNSEINANENDIPVHCPNWYTYTKLLADAYVEAASNNYLTIRTSFKPRPFPHKAAWSDLIGNFDYIDTISSLIIDLVNKGAQGIFNVGTDVKTIYELALQTQQLVLPFQKKRDDIRPLNITMDLTKMNKLLNNEK